MLGASFEVLGLCEQYIDLFFFRCKIPVRLCKNFIKNFSNRKVYENRRKFKLIMREIRTHGASVLSSERLLAPWGYI